MKDFEIIRKHTITIDGDFCNQFCSGLTYSSFSQCYECKYNNFEKIKTEWENNDIKYIRCNGCKKDVP